MLTFLLGVRLGALGVCFSVRNRMSGVVTLTGGASWPAEGQCYSVSLFATCEGVSLSVSRHMFGLTTSAWPMKTSDQE